MSIDHINHSTSQSDKENTSSGQDPLLEDNDSDKSKEYGASSIKVLGGVEAVRQTPAMYIGDTSSYGLHHLVYEIVDNSIDEALAGYCTHIAVVVHPDNSITVTDNGRGIPVDIHEKENKSALEVITTTLHAGGKFDRNSYKVSGGLHGVGISVVNALTEKMEVEVSRDGYVHFQGYMRGKPLGEVKKLGKTQNHGSKIWFKPDPEIFEDCVYSYGVLSKRLRELSFLNRRVHISLSDQRESKTEVFYNEEGIKAFVEHLNQNRNPIHREIIHIDKQVEIEKGVVRVELAMQYQDGYNETTYAYANNIHTREGGTHLSGFKSALTRTLNGYGKKENLLKEKIVPIGDDWREGLTLVLTVKLPHPQFEGQTKAKLGNREIQGIVETVVNEELSIYLEEHPQTAKAIINKGANAAHVRQATKKVRDLERQRKSPLHSGGLPGKLADCSSKDVESTELYLVEGDSAGGSAKAGRDRRFQAILPLRGKILNVEKARLDKILAHNEIKTIVTALGAGIQNEFDVSKRRYGKLIIMTDADVDGSHIRTLLLTFLFRNMRPLLEAGCVYIAQPPLYRFKRRRKEQYVYSDREFQTTLVEFGMEGTILRINDSMELKDDNLAEVLKALASLGYHLRMLEKYGISPREFLAHRDSQSGNLPRFQYFYNNKHGYFYSEDELNSFIENEEQRLHQEIFVQENLDKALNGSSHLENILYKSEIHGAEEIYKSVAVIAKAGLSLDNYFEPGPEYQLVDDKDVMTGCRLSEVLEQVKILGRKGLDVQRYKGLGEMNAEQLWMTTMNPQTRTLFKVRLEDASEAERLFSILMGNNVEPRREFIEKHALEVRELDV